MTLRAVPLLLLAVLTIAVTANAARVRGLTADQFPATGIPAASAHRMVVVAATWNLANFDKPDHEQKQKKPKPIHGDEMTLPVALTSGLCVLSGYFLVSRVRSRRRTPRKNA